MTEARTQESAAAQPPEQAARNLQREAFMRSGLRAALKEFDGKIAVVTGAWHVGALRQLGDA